MDRQVDSEALRSLVREVLRDLLPTAGRVAPARLPANAATFHVEPRRVEEVSIANDAELAAFVSRLLRSFADPAAREALRTGAQSFRLANRGTAAQTGGAAGGAERIDTGVLSETKVIGLARTGRRILLGRRVVVTPLARDKARQLGVKLERET